MRKIMIIALTIGFATSLSVNSYAAGDNSPGDQMKISEVKKAYDVPTEIFTVSDVALQLALQVAPEFVPVEVENVAAEFYAPDPLAFIVTDKSIKEGMRPQKPDKINLGYSTAADATTYKADIAERTWKDIHRRQR